MLTPLTKIWGMCISKISNQHYEQAYSLSKNGFRYIRKVLELGKGEEQDLIYWMFDNLESMI